MNFLKQHGVGDWKEIVRVLCQPGGYRKQKSYSGHDRKLNRKKVLTTNDTHEFHDFPISILLGLLICPLSVEVQELYSLQGPGPF